MKHSIKKFVAIAVTIATAILPFANAAPAFAAAPNWNTTGNYTIDFDLGGSHYVHDLSLTQTGATLAGNGGYPAGGPHTYTWVLTSGTVDGDTIDFLADYTASADAVTPQTTMHVTGTIAPNGTMSGTWSDNYQGGQRAGTWVSATGAAAPIQQTSVDCPANTTATFVENVSVNSNSVAPTMTANALVNGDTYLLKASGTWVNTPYNVSDAEFTSTDSWATHADGYDINPYMLGEGEFDLQVNGGFVNWGPYSATHQYSYLVAGAGSTASLGIFDGDSNGPTVHPEWYGDNVGSLSVDVYHCVPNTVTPPPFVAACPVGTTRASSPLETVSVSSTQSTDTLSTNVLTSGMSYVLRASGVADAGDNIAFDAKYSFRTPTSVTWTDSVSTYESYGPTLLDLLFNGTTPWGGFENSHVYEALVTGNGSQAHFLINDAYYPNNTGSLSVDIIPCVPNVQPHVHVTIAKYVDGKHASVANANNASFSMQAVYNFTNEDYPNGISSSDPYTISSVGNGTPTSYEAKTREFYPGASYKTYENMDSTVGASCADNKPFALVGYSVGTDEASAASGQVTLTQPNFTGLQNNQFVIVWNKTCPQTGTISGMKFNDINRNGKKDPNEPGLQGWTIKLMLDTDDGDDDDHDTIVATAVTDAQGNYTFTNVLPGTYDVREKHQKGWKRQTKNPKDIVITGGSVVTGVDFGNAVTKKGEKEDTDKDDNHTDQHGKYFGNHGKSDYSKDADSKNHGHKED